MTDSFAKIQFPTSHTNRAGTFASLGGRRRFTPCKGAVHSFACTPSVSSLLRPHGSNGRLVSKNNETDSLRIALLNLFHLCTVQKNPVARLRLVSVVADRLCWKTTVLANWKRRH